MTYQEAIDFLFSSLPMYQREGKAAYKANLDNTHRLDNYFGHPHRKFKTIHVAGTNGKGSVSHMLSSVFQEAGYRTGLYTSPHLLDFRERIRVDGRPIPKDSVTGFIKEHHEIIRELRPSFFEMSVAIAFDHFASEKVEFAVIETGLGGRLDSTNIITPEVSVITNISKDHTEFLGEDLLSIASEKGGIIKEGVPLVIGSAEVGIEQFFLSMARDRLAPVTLAYKQKETVFHTFDKEDRVIIRLRDMKSGKLETIRCDLTGQYQHENVITTLSTIHTLKAGRWDLPESSIEEGLANVVKNTGLMGRWQTLGVNPRSICDSAHNPAGISATINQVMQVPWKELHVVWGMVNDKDLDSILPLLPEKGRYYFTRSSVPRSLDAVLLQKAAEKFNLKGNHFPSVEIAYREALSAAEPSHMVFTGGSTFVVADLLKALGY
jgi:dihydrofolate synthase/folylpolyglutamate synthase